MNQHREASNNVPPFWCNAIDAARLGFDEVWDEFRILGQGCAYRYIHGRFSRIEDRHGKLVAEKALLASSQVFSVVGPVIKEHAEHFDDACDEYPYNLIEFFMRRVENMRWSA